MQLKLLEKTFYMQTLSPLEYAVLIMQERDVLLQCAVNPGRKAEAFFAKASAIIGKATLEELTRVITWADTSHSF